MTRRELTFCIPIDPPLVGGGGFRFLRSLETYLEGAGIQWTRRVRDGADVLFTNAWHVPVRSVLLAAAANPAVTVVHRVDGAAADYGRDAAADRAQSRVDRVSDLTIFQSEYCRFSTREKFAVIRHDGPVIYNPVDLLTFTPDGPSAHLPPHAGPRVCAVTWSTNPRKGMGVVYRLATRLPGVQFVLCGRFDDAPDLPNIVRTGVLQTAQLAAHLRACDVLATFAENEACPNVVLEALASGLPVLFRDSGAAKELVGDCGVAVEEMTFGRMLMLVLAWRPALAQAARERAIARFAPEDVFGRYVSEIRHALRPADRSRPARLAELAVRAFGRA